MRRIITNGLPVLIGFLVGFGIIESLRETSAQMTSEPIEDGVPAVVSGEPGVLSVTSVSVCCFLLPWLEGHTDPDDCLGYDVVTGRFHNVVEGVELLNIQMTICSSPAMCW